MFQKYIGILLALSLVVSSVQARTKLTALPERARFAVNLEHPSESLAIEERTLPLVEGLNRIDFSWQGVNIDPASIQIEMLTSPGETKILNVTYPPNENALVWEIAAPSTQQERVRISYLLRGINRKTEYRLVANKGETRADFEAHYYITNHSGEDFEDAAILTIWPRDIERSMRNGASRKITTLRANEMPIEKRFVLEPRLQSADADQKYRARMQYAFDNNDTNGLGQLLMPGGKYRIFQQDPQGSRIFVGENMGKQLAVGDDQELFLGMANDVVVKRVEFDRERKNIRRNSGRKVVVYDEMVTIRYEAENFRDESTELVIKERIGDYWNFDEITAPSGVTATHERISNDEIEITLQLPKSDEKQIIDFIYERKNILN